MKETLRQINGFSKHVLIEDLPSLLAVVDYDGSIQSCTNYWKNKFKQNVGGSVYDLPIFQWKGNGALFREALLASLDDKFPYALFEEIEEEKVYRWQLKKMKAAEGLYFCVDRVYIKTAFEQRRRILRGKANKVAGVGYWEADLTRNTLLWSSVTREIHKVSSDYTPNLEDAINFYKRGYNRDRIGRVVQNAIDNREPWNEDLILINRQNKEVWVNARGEAQFEDGKCVRLLGTFRDITDSKKHESELRVSRERFKVAFNNTLVAFFLIDVDTFRVEEVNAAATRIFGYTKNEFKARSLNLIAHIQEKDVFYDNVDLLLESHTDKVNFTCNLKDREGSRVVANVDASVNYDEEGNPSKLLIQLEDITEFVKHKESVEESMEIIAGQNSRLLNFAYIVSHNLRSHTSNIAMLVDFLKNETNKKERAQQFDMLEKASDNLTETIKHLNEVVAIDLNVDEKEKVDINQSLKKIVEASQGLMKNTDFTIINDIPNGFRVPCIRAYMDSILLNLLTNAFRYRSSKKGAWVRFSAEMENGKSRIVVADNGLGIDLERHGDNLFKMYKTFHNHPDSKGLGLFLTRNQVETMGGTISVESKVDEGTIFTIELNGKN